MANCLHRWISRKGYCNECRKRVRIGKSRSRHYPEGYIYGLGKADLTSRRKQSV